MTRHAWHTRAVPGRTLVTQRIEAADVVLRKARDGDREAIIAHETDVRVRAHLGGAQARAAVEQDLDDVGVAAATGSPGAFVIAARSDDAFLGTMALTRRGAHRPGHISESGEELELSYTLIPVLWGRGLAFQAATAVLHAAARELPDEPVIVVTQSANVRSMNLARRLGFVPVLTFDEFDVEQTLWVVDLREFGAGTAGT